MSKILLVEDDPLIYRVYQKLLQHENYEVEIAENGQQGIDKLKYWPADLILLDIMMPKMNGIDMLIKIKTDLETKNIPVIVLTNVSNMQVANEAVAKGANSIIIKSETEPDQVISAIQAALGKALQQKSPPPADTQT